jgi:uncharacterized protein
LLHDIGHGPFSHTTESIFGFRHESLSIKIIEEEISPILEQENISTKDVISVISNLNNEKMKLLSQLVNSQLDADRLDYLARDIYFTGVGFGALDIERIIRTLTIYEDSGLLNGYAVVEEKGKHSIETYLHTRAIMYEDVYYHKTTRCVERILKQIFLRVAELSHKEKFKLPPELEFIRKMQGGESIEKTMVGPKDILPIDDHYIYSLLGKWSRDDIDKTLCDLSSRIQNRKLLKTREDIPNNYNSLLEINRKIKILIAQKTHFDPEHYCIMDEPEDTPYDPIKSPSNDEELQESLRRNIFVKLKDGSGYKEISDVSSVVDALTTTKQLKRIYFPEEIKDDIREILRKK